MRIKALSLLILLALCLSMAAPVYAVTSLTTLSPSTGAVGTTVTVTGSISNPLSSYYIYWDDQYVTKGTSEAAPLNAVNKTFPVPPSAKGIHTVILVEVPDPNDPSKDSEIFTVTPAISLSLLEGTVGSTVTVSGTGFATSEDEIEVLYDSAKVITNKSANTKGSWEATFVVPTSKRGAHTVDASGENTTSTEVTDLNFTVTPKISLEPTAGGTGTSVKVSGSGFAAGETNIYVTYDTTQVITNKSANTEGSWEATFVVPTSKRGSHVVDAYGATTLADDVPNVTFTISPAVTIDSSSGYVEDVINASGSGFAQNETSIQVTFDGAAVKTGITADANGSWTSSLAIPKSVGGSHIIDASGQTTPATEVTDAAFTVSPKIEINPAIGAIDENIAMSGNGFGSSQVITIKYNDEQVATGVATDTKGSFTTSFRAPESSGGSHTVTASDAADNSASAAFTMESTPPAIPAPLSPEPGSRIGFIGKTAVAFDWSDVTDPSGVSYILEISQEAAFSTILLRKEGLTQSQYALTDAEALDSGDYYWRVKAVDGAQNASDWTAAQVFHIGTMSLWLFVTIAVLAVALIVVIVWRIKQVWG